MISTVSIIGVDDSISTADLADISQKYPFVEWGINLCSEKESCVGFPSEEWIDSIIYRSPQLRLRGILHGRWLYDILQGNISVKLENPSLWESLQRVQIRTNEISHDLIEVLQLLPDKEIILSSKNLLEVDSIKLNAYPLLDKKHIHSYKQYCGYEINEYDMDLVLSKLDQNFWISIDGFRTNEVILDQLKIEMFLDGIESSITHDSMIKALLQTESIQKRLSQYPGEE